MTMRPGAGNEGDVNVQLGVSLLIEQISRLCHCLLSFTLCVTAPKETTGHSLKKQCGGLSVS